MLPHLVLHMGSGGSKLRFSCMYSNSFIERAISSALLPLLTQFLSPSPKLLGFVNHVIALRFKRADKGHPVLEVTAFEFLLLQCVR